MPRARTNRAVALALAFCAAAGGASAQSSAEDDGTGVRVGSILLTPTVILGVQYDDNIFREKAGRRASTILTARTAISGKTDWRRHSLGLEAALETGRFTASSADDYVDANIVATGILDISRAARLRMKIGSARRHERRGGDDAPTTLSGPVIEHTGFAEVTGQYAPGRLKVQPQISIERRDFDDRRLIGGGVGDQDDRDRTIYAAGVEVGYNLPGPLELTAAARLSRIDFSTTADRGGFDRDSTRLRITAGVEIDPERILSGAAELGYQRQFSDDPALADFSGPAAEVRLKWRPSRLLTLDLKARRAEEETTIAGASAASVAYGELRAVYEVRRFVDLSATAAYERRSFRGAARRDKTLVLGAGVEWRARRDTTLTARYRRIDETSNAPGESSRANLIWFSAEHRF